MVAAGASYSLAITQPPELSIGNESFDIKEAERKSFKLDINSGELVDASETKRSTDRVSNQVLPTPKPVEDVKQYDQPTVDPEFRSLARSPIIATPPAIGEEGSPVSEVAKNEPVALTVPETPKLEKVDFKSFVVKKGDTLSGLFKRAGLNDGIMYQVIHGKGEATKIQRLYPGETISFGITKEGKLDSISLKRNPMKYLVIEKSDDTFEGKYELKTPDVMEKTVSGVIEDSLYLSAKQVGLSDKTIMELAGLFGWDIDFVYDIRRGDRFEVVFEEKYVDGEFLETGRILAARFTNQGDQHIGLYHPGEDSDYYTPEGKSLKKAFLRTPINARVSSPFNLQRRHPVLDIVRPHEGIDYAAPVGTPIKASGSGKVTFAGWKGGYGKTVIISHGGNITTLYAHMNDIKKGIKKGVKVKQGETVGYLGSTGMVTGPHLHYEFRVAGVAKNPKTVKLPDATPLKGTQLAEFREKTRSWQQMLNTTMIATNDN